MVTLIGYIKEDDFRIIEYERIECENDAEAITKGQNKCLSKLCQMNVTLQELRCIRCGLMGMLTSRHKTKCSIGTALKRLWDRLV